MKNNRLLQSGIIILVALLLGFYNLPGEMQKQILPFLPSEITDQKVSLGLDLQGGSQLDYKVDLRDVPEKDQANIIDGIINVIQKRVNGLGVSEPNIYPSVVGDEHHIIVELAGIKDLDQAKETVGKTIQLEFKEQRLTPDTNHAAEVKSTADKSVTAAKKAADFKIYAEGEAQANPGKVTYNENKEFQFRDQLPTSLADEAFKLKVGEISDKTLESTSEYALDSASNVVQMNGYSIIKVLERQTADKQINEPRKVSTSEILVQYKGIPGVPATITRTEEEAKARATEALTKIQGGADFAEIAKQYSDDTDSKDKGGVKTEPVSKDANYVQEYKDAADALKKVGDLSPVTKSPLGFHIIKALAITDAVNKTVKEDQVKLGRLFYNSSDDPWLATSLNGKYFQRADIGFDQLGQAHVEITFNAEGAKMFEDLTAKNVNKPIAIFVGGNLISAPNVNEKISGGKAIITGRFTIKKAQDLARDLNTGAIPAPVLLVGQYNIGASLGQDALNKSLMAGLIGLALIALYMIIVYRLAGAIATIALFFYTALLIFLIKCSLPLPVALVFAVAVFGFLVYKILNSKESGPEKLIALVLACFILFFMSFLISTQVVMTLAGIAGVILSIGMAVDANILIFERVKEEIRDGRPLESAVNVGFDRAWSSIKDSNFSSLITCAILFYFGSSIIQGFAFNLAAGILVSMFSAISITKVLLHAALNTSLGEYKGFFGIPKRHHAKLPIIAKRRILYSISAITVVLAVIALSTMGLKPSLDFTGGSLMEIKFAKSISTDELTKSLQDIGNQINKAKLATPATKPATPAITGLPAGVTVTALNTDGTPQASSAAENSLQADSNAQLDTSSFHVVTSGDALLIKSKDISAIDHDEIIKQLKAKYGELEEKRFQSVGPTIGESLRNRAFLAVALASLAIVLYIGFAFRKVPSSVGKWKFGISAIVALLHDTLVMIGIYVALGQVMGVEIDALFITAILTVMGFSVHDTIVVLDRLREKLKSPAKDKTFADLTNDAVNETMSRSIGTSFTVVLALLSLILFGAESIRAFNLALLIGIVVGTYSSIFIASPLLVDWYNAAHTAKK